MRVAPSPQPVVNRSSDTLPMTREALQIEQVKTKTQDRLNNLSQSLKNDAWGGPPSMFQNMSDKIVNDGAREIQQIRNGGGATLENLKPTRSMIPPMPTETLQVEQVKTKTQDRLKDFGESLRNTTWGGPASMIQNIEDKIINDGALEIQQLRDGGQSFESLPELPQDLSLPEATLPMTREDLQVEQVKTKTQDRLKDFGESLRNNAWGGPVSMIQNIEDKIINDGTREIQQLRNGGPSGLTGQF
ncbi:hypothetical protein SAMN05444354_1154 [Stigmatella aurantiaca]|uniref:Uncharacterized protein n=1 Tax=Stigmatella aurantiaca TaxID=41 RepID=A0A1H7XHS5_STIAU|nr:hypothetical protein [Stigmatella aurantiaca]SEM32717.1 hypothetical protein SAMN05444354_1154 [Stigmatella aurantiaca]